MARDQKGAEAQRQTILFIDESGFYPLPSVVRTYVPMGRTPTLKEWRTRDHLSAISALSPEGKLYFHTQDCALDSADVVAFLECEHLTVLEVQSLRDDALKARRSELDESADLFARKGDLDLPLR